MFIDCNNAKALARKVEKQKQQDAIIVAKEQKKDAYDADMKSLATEALNVAKQNQRTTNKTFWAAVVSVIIGLITLIFK